MHVLTRRRYVIGEQRQGLDGALERARADKQPTLVILQRR